MLAGMQSQSPTQDEVQLKKEEQALLSKMAATPQDGDALVHLIKKRKAEGDNIIGGDTNKTDGADVDCKTTKSKKSKTQR